MDNARLNVEIAQAQLKGAKLSYFPSLAFAPNGGTASYGGSHMNWSYTLPLSASWEIDAFGKILNRKRAAEVGVQQAENYRCGTLADHRCRGKYILCHSCAEYAA